MKGLNVVILAAGKGERMMSKKSKVMHEIMGKPMIGHAVERAQELTPDAVVVVVGYGREQVEGYLKDKGVLFSLQAEQKGTGHALLTAEHLLKDGDVLVFYGDVPLMESTTLRAFLASYEETGDITFMVTDVDNPKGYGRVIMEGDIIQRIVEENDATEDQKMIATINTGICIIPRSAFHFLKAITPNNRKGEYYLTDICTIAEKEGKSVRGYRHYRAVEVLGINSRKELMEANMAMKDRILDDLLEKGVTLLDRNIYISPSVTIGKDTIVSPNCYISGKTTIGEDVVIGPNSIIKDSIIADNVTIKGFVSIEGTSIETGAEIGPFSRLRPETFIKEKVKIGNFVEVKKSILKTGAKASHLSYIGDSEIGSNVNIGAGTITCNYDGTKKHKTIIEDNAFVGSNTSLVAPVRIGKNAVIGAGSTIAKDVPENALGVTRAPQKNVEGYSSTRRTK